MGQTATQGEGIDADRLYTLRGLKASLGWSDSTLRAAVRRGLKVFRDGKRGYVPGREVISFLTSNREEVGDE